MGGLRLPSPSIQEDFRCHRPRLADHSPLATAKAGEAGGPNLGFAALSQTKLINFDATLVQNATFNIPAGSQIVDFYVDALTAYDSVTSALVSAGTATGGTQYLSAVSAKTAGRRPNAFSAAQLAAMANVGTNRAVVATVTSLVSRPQVRFVLPCCMCRRLPTIKCVGGGNVTRILLKGF